MDFLKHEVGPSTLFRRGHIPIHVEGAHRALTAHGRQDTHTVRAHLGNFLVLQQRNLPGVAQDGRNIAGGQVFPFAEAQHQGAVLADGPELVRFAPMQHAQGPAALQHARRLTQRLHHVAAVQVMQQMRDNLRIRLGNKHAPLPFQEFPQPLMILNDAIMHQGNVALYIRMGMRVQIAGLPMGGPPGMTDAQVAMQRMRLQPVPEILQPALGLAHLNLALIHHRDTRAVISPIFQVLQPAQQNLLRAAWTHISYNSAHVQSSSYVVIRYNTYCVVL